MEETQGWVGGVVVRWWGMVNKGMGVERCLREVTDEGQGGEGQGQEGG